MPLNVHDAGHGGGKRPRPRSQHEWEEVTPDKGDYDCCVSYALSVCGCHCPCVHCAGIRLDAARSRAAVNHAGEVCEVK